MRYIGILGCDSQQRQNGETDCLPLHAERPWRKDGNRH